jgi:hypothetical protein
MSPLSEGPASTELPEAKGWFQGSMSGPEWLTGGQYGVEASAVALIVWSLCAALLLHRNALVRRGTP